jgi:hypothetical protein
MLQWLLKANAIILKLGGDEAKDHKSIRGLAGF